MARLRYEVIRTNLSFADFRVTGNTSHTKSNSSAPRSWIGLRNIVPTISTTNSSTGTRPQTTHWSESQEKITGVYAIEFREQ